MKLYTVTAPEDRAKRHWAGSQADAAKVKNDLWDKAKEAKTDTKRADIEITAVDVPTDKAGLLNFLNNLT